MNTLTVTVTIRTYDDRPGTESRLLAELDRSLRYRFTDVTLAITDPEDRCDTATTPTTG